MESPEKDIISIIFELTTTSSPDVQRATVHKYMTPDVSFDHPVCSVHSGPNSRERVLKIFQWYRVLSPQVDLRVDSVIFDSDNDVLYIEMVQWFRLFFLPVNPQPARLLTRLELRKVQNLYYISRQEDFYHTLDFVKLVLPPLAPLIYLWLSFGAIFSYFCAIIAQQFGFWVPSPTNSGVSGKEEEEEYDGPGDREELYD